MKAPRVALFLLAALALAACEPGADPASITAPVALAAANSVSHTICSSPATTELQVGAAWVPAFFTLAQQPHAQPLPGSTWVGPLPNSSNSGAPAGTYVFRTAFTVPAGARNVRLEGAVHADNEATFFLNGAEFFSQPSFGPGDPGQYSNFQDPASELSTHGGFLEGANVVTVEVQNYGTEPSQVGVNFCYTVSYKVPASGGGGGGDRGGCPAAPAVAAHYLQSLGLQPSRADGENVVARVAERMGPGSSFDGLETCDAGYAAAVQGYVDALLP